MPRPDYVPGFIQFIVSTVDVGVSSQGVVNSSPALTMLASEVNDYFKYGPIAGFKIWASANTIIG